VTGYSLFLLDGIATMPLHLSYPCYSDAVRVKQKLETVYGTDAITIEANGRAIGDEQLAGGLAIPELQYA
jgi:hypothetical protein